jgi:pilus assembly protein CpaF
LVPNHLGLLERIDASAAAKLPREELQRQIAELIGEIVAEEKLSVTSREQQELTITLVDDMVGLGPLEPLLADESVNDIMINGPSQVYVERRGKLQLTEVRFRDNAHVMNIARRIVTRIGRRVDETSPIADARLPDGSRVNIIAPPLAIDGCSISIRKFSKKSITLDVMESQGNISANLAKVLKIAAASRLNVVISGGTGSGKTTMLNALSQLIDPTDAWSRSRTLPNCSCSSPMSSAWKRDRRISRAPARSPCATWSRMRSACVRTGSSAARSAGPRRSTCFRP